MYLTSLWKPLKVSSLAQGKYLYFFANNEQFLYSNKSKQTFRNFGENFYSDLIVKFYVMSTLLLKLNNFTGSQLVFITSNTVLKISQKLLKVLELSEIFCAQQQSKAVLLFCLSCIKLSN